MKLRRFAVVLVILLALIVVGNPGVMYAAKVVDTDGDGLSDKLEKVFKTSITKKDTDSDGYTDLEEITNNYNPLGKGIWKPTKAMSVAWKNFQAEQKKAKLSGNKKSAEKPQECGEVNDNNKANVLKCMDQALKNCKPAVMEEGDLFGMNRQEIFQQKGVKNGCAVKLSYKKISDSVLGGNDLKGKEMVCPLDQTKKTYRDSAPENYAGCSGTLKNAFDKFLSAFPQQQPTIPQQEIAFETLGTGMFKGQKKKDYVEVNFQDDWDVLWNALYPNKDSRPPEPTINFSEKKIIALFGNRGDFSIRLTSLSDQGGTASFSIEQEQQRKKCPVVRTLQQPFIVIDVPKTVGNQGGRVTFPNRVEKDCQLPGLQEPDETFLYKNQKFDLSILLPDAVQYFTTTESEKETSQFGKLSFIEFSQFSGKENKAVESFTLVLVPTDTWAAVEKAGGIGLVSGGWASASKIGATKKYVVAWYGVGGDLFGADDVGKYSSEDLTVVSNEK